MRNFVLILLTAFCHLSVAQNKYEGRIDVMDKYTNPAGIVDELPLPPAGVEGNTYLLDDWRLGKIYLKNGQAINGYELRLDLQNNNLEVKDKDQIKICPYGLINRFVLYNIKNNDSVKYVKANNFLFKDDVPLLGFFEFVYDGNYSIVNYYKTSIQQSNYVEALDMGDRDKKIVINTTQYFIKGNSVMCEFSTRIKSMKDCLPGEYQQHKTYIKENDINLKKEKGQIAFLSYLNGLNQ